MLTHKQRELLMFIHERLRETGVPPSFEEMKEALDLASKSGIHRLIKALEERGFIRRLSQRARALEIVKLPNDLPDRTRPAVVKTPLKSRLIKSHTQTQDDSATPAVHVGITELPFLGKIAAGTPIAAIQEEQDRFFVSTHMLGEGDHFILEVQGDSMREAGIFDGDLVIIRRTHLAQSGDIVVALIMGKEATLKRLRCRNGGTLALEPANRNYEARIYSPDQVKIEGKLTGLLRRYG